MFSKRPCPVRTSPGDSLFSYSKNRRLLVKSSLRRGSKDLAQGEKYKSCCRFKRILHDSCIPIEIPKIVKTTCSICEGPMKVKIFPNPRKTGAVVEEVWGGQSHSESPQIQKLFDNWLYDSNEYCKTEETETKKANFYKPHHYYHHKMIKKEKPIVDYEKHMFCAGCPDRYRSWKRKDQPDHFFEPLLMLTRKSSLGNQQESEKDGDKTMHTRMLKEALNDILSSTNLRQTISFSL